MNTAVSSVDVELLNNFSDWLKKHAQIAPVVAKKYADQFLAAGIGSVEKLARRVARNSNLLIEFNVDEDDAVDINRALQALTTIELSSTKEEGPSTLTKDSSTALFVRALSTASLLNNNSNNAKNTEDLFNKSNRFLLIGDNVSSEERFQFQKSYADDGNADAQYEIGVCYFDGNNVSQDKAEAFRYFKLSADQGYAEAQYKVGVCYGEGEGVELNKIEAFKYYKLSADQGNSEAKYKVACCYFSGDGVEANKAEAFKYYQYCLYHKYSE